MSEITEFGDIGPARGGRKREVTPLIIEIVRSLTEEDLAKLQSPDSLGTSPIPIQQLRASHHQLAQILSQGVSDAEAALITGYSPVRISILKSMPAFADLMATYKDLRERTFADTLERMRTLGLSTLDELQERLESNPEKWTNRELMEMADLLLVKPQMAGASALAAKAATGSGSGVVVNVQFVKADTPPLQIESLADHVKVR